MMGLQIDISPDSSFSLEGEFGNISFNGLETVVTAQRGTDRGVLSFPVHRLEVLGQGSSSIVYKSVMLTKLCVTAEKVFLVGDSTKQLQLFRELQSLKSVCSSPADTEGTIRSASPYIVELLDVFSNPADGTLSLCLEYMDCGSLENLLQAGGCRDELILSSIAFQMASGLSFLHERRMIHRDVKPSNALISRDGCIKLADFGLARTLDSGQSLANSFVGTFLYMAPERLTGESYSYQSDIWGLGLTLHAVALGQYPYVGKKGYWEVLHATQQGGPPIAAAYSVALISLLKSCYHANPRDRPSTVALLQMPLLKAAPATIPPELRHTVCKVPLHQDILSTAAVASAIVPGYKTPLSLPQSAPCTVAGNLTFRPALESKSARKLTVGTQVRNTSTTVSGNARTALMQQQRATGKTINVDSYKSRSAAATRPSGNSISGSTQQKSSTNMNTRVGRAGASATQATAAGNSAKVAKIPAPGGSKLVHSASDRSTVSLASSASKAALKVRSASAGPAKYTGAVRKAGVATEETKSCPEAAQLEPTSCAVNAVPAGSQATTTKHQDAPVLVRAWEKYVVLAREQQLREASKRGGATSASPLPGGTPIESYDYVASPSVAVNSLRRLVAKQHDSREVFVTEQIVQRLASHMHCDGVQLRGEFCAALERINKAWRGTAVSRIPPKTAASPPVSAVASTVVGTVRASSSGGIGVKSVHRAPQYASAAPVEECKGEQGLRSRKNHAAVDPAEHLEVEEDLCVPDTGDAADILLGACSLDGSIEEDLDLLHLHLGLKPVSVSLGTPLGGTDARGKEWTQRQEYSRAEAVRDRVGSADDYGDESFEAYDEE
jgi:serine/threonine protein kinase